MSRGLRALKRIRDYMEANVKHWKQDVGYIDEELRALEIIKKKKVDAYSFIKNNYQNYDEYLDRMCFLNGCNRDNLFEKCYGILTQEEYELLKEVLL